MRRAASTDANQPEIVAASCPTCNGPVTPDRKGRKKVYCSRRCVGVAVGKANHLRVKGRLRHYVCDYCARPFSCYYDNRRFCSHDCASTYKAAFTPMGRWNGTSNDANQSIIVDAFHKLGVSVLVTSRLGKGFPDLIVACHGHNHLVEVKNPDTQYGRKGLNPRQQKWQETWRGGPVHIVRTIDDVARLVSQWRPKHV